jgi:hypothetical protein
MGAGISSEQERKMKYNRLKAVERELRKAGVEATYANKSVQDADLMDDDYPRFSVTFGTTMRASNGEAWGVMNVFVAGPNGPETYRLHDAKAGIERIKALYGTDQTKLGETEVQAEVVAINNVVKYKGDKETNVFLHKIGPNGVWETVGKVWDAEYRPGPADVVGNVVLRLEGNLHVVLEPEMRVYNNDTERAIVTGGTAAVHRVADAVLSAIESKTVETYTQAETLLDQLGTAEKMEDNHKQEAWKLVMDNEASTMLTGEDAPI